MDFENEQFIEGQTRSGIKFKIDKRITEDNRTMYFIRNMRKYKDNKEKQDMVTDSLYSLFELMFGSGEGFLTFMNEVAARHDGVADSATLIDELTDIFEACNLKN